MLKLVKALDLQHWADTKESEALMPELMRLSLNQQCIGYCGLMELSLEGSNGRLL